MTNEAQYVNVLTSILTKLTYSVRNYDHIDGFVPINYTLTTSQSTVEFANELSENIIFNSKYDVKILCHDFNASEIVDWYNYMTKEYLKRGKTVVFALHYQVPNKTLPDIEQVAYHKKLGEQLADFIVKLRDFYKVDLDKVHFLGHGHGAHIAGLAGRNVVERTDQQIGRITELDPTHTDHMGWDREKVTRGGDAKFIDNLQLSYGSYYYGGLNVVNFMMDGTNFKCEWEEFRKAEDVAAKVFSSTINGKGIKVHTCLGGSWGNKCKKSFAVMGDSMDQEIDGTYLMEASEEICRILNVRLVNEM